MHERPNVSPCLLYVGTKDGVYVFYMEGDRLSLVGRGIERNAVRGIAIHPNNPEIAYVGCGLDGWGLHYTKDAGKNWESLGFKDLWVWDVVIHPSDSKTILVGTEPPMIYISNDEGRTFKAFSSIDKLPSRKNWSFFYEPFYAGHIHGIAIHPKRPERIFAGVEHGALIYTHDYGETWHEALIGHDIHRIAIDPQDPDRIFAGTGEGLFISTDAGRSWILVTGMENKYVHGICFDPNEPTRVFIYVSEPENPIYLSNDGGITFKPIGKGLPANGPADSFSIHPDNPEVLFYGGEIRNRRGQLFISIDGGKSWRTIGEEMPKIWRLRVAKLKV
jgi:photosystem II stability/assembly factor-like uncharacterized protein